MYSWYRGAQRPLPEPSVTLHPPPFHPLPGLHRLENLSKTKWLERTSGALLGDAMKDLSGVWQPGGGRFGLSSGGPRSYFPQGPRACLTLETAQAQERVLAPPGLAEALKVMFIR